MTTYAALAAGAITTAALTPSAITWCMANLQACGVAISDMAAGNAVGPTGIGGLTGLMGVRGTKLAKQANDEWTTAVAGRLPTYVDGSTVLVADLSKGQRVVMYVNAAQAERLSRPVPELDALGGWATLDRSLLSHAEVRQQFALLPEFKSGTLYRVELEVVSSRVPVQVGYTGPLISKVDGVLYEGGAPQVQLMEFSNRANQFRVVMPPTLVPGGP